MTPPFTPAPERANAAFPGDGKKKAGTPTGEVDPFDISPRKKVAKPELRKTPKELADAPL